MGQSLKHAIALPDGDVLILAGDLTQDGELDELRDLNDWLSALPHAHKLVIAGNHDYICEEVPELVPQLLHNATYLCDTMIVIAGAVFFGSPWTPGGGGWAFSRSPNALVYCWAEIPEHTDVLITHGPPHARVRHAAGARASAPRRTESSALRCRVLSCVS